MHALGSCTAEWRPAGTRGHIEADDNYMQKDNRAEAFVVCKLLKVCDMILKMCADFETNLCLVCFA